jgi:hypothetical protein
VRRPARPGTAPEAGKPSTGGGNRAGRAGLALTALSIAATIVTGLAGPSAMEPALPGRPGQPPWDLGLQLPPAAAIGLAAAALAAGTAGLGLCLHALRRGWTVSPRAVLAAGLTAAAVITLAPPYGSSDQLSYAAYGRMVVTGHDPYLTTPAMLARLGDPVARAVQDWRGSPSVYGGLATDGQALASWIGGDSARLTAFVLSLLGLAAFAGTGLLLHLLTRGSRPRQLRAGLLWALNPLLLQVLVAGAHVDSQAIAFAVAAIAVFALGMPNEKVRARPIRRLGLAAATGAVAGLAAREAHQDAPAAPRPFRSLGVATAAGALAGLACAVKLSFMLVAAGLVVAALLAWWPPPTSAGRPGRWRPLALAVGGVMAGFMVTAAAALLPWGPQSAGPALRAGSYVSIGSPWRVVRSGLRLLVGEGHADSLVRAGAIVLAAALLALFARPLRRLAGAVTAARLTVLAGASCFVLGFTWLVAWPYVLPWYDGLGWALLALLPWTPLPWAALDWLVLARTAALAFGYLPARGITPPPDLGWLRSVVRTGVTPAALLVVAVTLVLLLWPYRPRWRPRAARRAGPDAGSTMGSRLAR